MLRCLALFFFFVGNCVAGDWQATAAAGFGSYHPLTFSAPAGTAEAGIGPRYMLNAAVGRRFGEHFAIEGVWTFQDGDFEISSGGVKTAFDANAHAVHGDVLGYLLPRSSRFRPYVVGGAGGKFYHGQEPPNPARPLAQFGGFRDGTDSRALLTYGGGVEYRFSPRWSLRLDLRDYTTPFPASVIVPVAGAHLNGWLHDFGTVLGVTFR